MKRDKTPADVPRGVAGKWLPGTSPNPGGRPAKLRAIEEMIDKNHRNVEVMREVFDRLKALALGEVVEVFHKGELVGLRLQADAAFMKLYLDRVLGPVKEQMDGDEFDELLKGAPQPVVDWARGKLVS